MTATGTDPDAPSPPPAGHGRHGFVAELRHALTARTVGLIVGVLAIQLAFIGSYVGAFHHPTPHRISVQVVAPPQAAAPLVAALNGLHGRPVRATVADDEASARQALRQDRTAAVFIPDVSGTDDTLLVASAGGQARASAMETVFGQLESAQHRQLHVQDLVPAQAGDARGLSAFYLVIGWLVGGYLLASLLGIAAGPGPPTAAGARIRLIFSVPYSILSGLGGALIIGPIIGALNGNFAAVAGVGTLLVLSAATVTTALQVCFGIVGIGITVLFFVVVGNPSAGGAYQTGLLPAFWRVVGGALPNGAGVTAIRQIIYFGSSGITGPLLVICAWMVGGVAVTLLATGLAATRRRSAGLA